MAALTAEQQKEFVDAFRELATETGVDGVPRLVALATRIPRKRLGISARRLK